MIFYSTGKGSNLKKRGAEIDSDEATGMILVDRGFLVLSLDQLKEIETVDQIVPVENIIQTAPVQIEKRKYVSHKGKNTKK